MAKFDPYFKWLGILPAEQPPNHYRLLGIPVFVDDADVIENAADRQMTHLRSFAAGKHAALSQQLLNDVSAAKVVLLNTDQRAAYDAVLTQELAVAAEGRGPTPPIADVSTASNRQSASVQPAEEPAAEEFDFTPSIAGDVRRTRVSQRNPARRSPMVLGGIAALLLALVIAAVVAIGSRSVLVDAKAKSRPLPDVVEGRPKAGGAGKSDPFGRFANRPGVDGRISIPAAGALRPATKAVYLDDLDETEFSVFPTAKLGKQGNTGFVPGQPQKCRLRGVFVTHALSAHPSSKGSSHVIYDLQHAYATLTATAALLDRDPGDQTVAPLVFRVYGDGRMLWESRPLQRLGEGQDFAVKIDGVHRLKLEVVCPDIANIAWAAWINPRLLTGAGAP